MDVEPVTLEGVHVRLEPLSLDHLDGLCKAGLHPEIWEWMADVCETREDLLRYVESALADRDRGTALPFATLDRASGKVVGSTRFGNISVADRRVEIGWTWIDPDWQRTYINTEAKFLMLRHAFEVWKCVRVELKTDALNLRSQQAMARIGAVREGTLRRHMITASGRRRDSVYFSVIDEEWPKVRQNFVEKLLKH
jgi:RimJ/RimL family protein N-acetyltransferase